MMEIKIPQAIVLFSDPGLSNNMAENMSIPNAGITEIPNKILEMIRNNLRLLRFFNKV